MVTLPAKAYSLYWVKSRPEVPPTSCPLGATSRQRLSHAVWCGAEDERPSLGLLFHAHAEFEQTSSDLAHDFPHLVVGRMKRRGGTAAPPLDRAGDDLCLATIHQVAAVGVVVRGARRRVEPDRLLHLVFA